MFCTNCGSQMAEGERFCTKCGSPLEQAPAPASVQAPPMQQPPMGYPVQGGAPIPPKKKSGKGSIVVIVLASIIIVAAAVIIAMTLLPSNSASSTAASASSSATGREASGSSNAAVVEDGASSVSGTASSPSASSTTSSSPSSQATVAQEQDGPVDEAGLLSDPEAYASMNVFLSNFSETGMQSIADVQSADAEDLVRFALSHDVINSNTFVETAPAADAMTNGAGDRMGSRESADRVSELLQRYMGTDVDYGSLSAGRLYGYRNGYVYFSTSDVERSPQGVANVVGSKRLSDGTLEVQFRVYAGSGYDATDEGLYALSADELMNRLGVRAAAYEGTAVVRTGGSNEATDGLTLVSYKVEM